MKSSITFDYQDSGRFYTGEELEAMFPKVKLAHEILHNKTGPGKEFTGWMDWPLKFQQEEYQRVKQVSEEIRERADAFIVVGVGGSYMGARAAIEMLGPPFYQQEKPEIYYAGHHMSSIYLKNLLHRLDDKKEIYVNVISKSGKTLEPAIAFRLLRSYLEERYGKEGAKKRIIATTDREQGALKKVALHEGYRTFVVPEDIGGRFSVLTSVGLLPIAVTGINIDEMMEGAAAGKERYDRDNFYENPAYQYAAFRNLFYEKGKTIELLINYEPAFHYFGEWWKQLFGESEGKNGKGLFPASALFSTDLHSLGQYIQEGRRNLFVTTLWVESADGLEVPHMENCGDGLDELAGTKIGEIKKKVCEGTIRAHTDGGVPNLKVYIPEVSPYYFGQLVYFFEKACGISGYLLGVNPFNQPGVEMYKKHVSRLLAKPKSTGK